MVEAKVELYLGDCLVTQSNLRARREDFIYFLLLWLHGNGTVS